MIVQKIFLAAACAAAMVTAHGAPAAAPAAPPPLADFFETKQFAGAHLSPDGTNLALLMRGPEGNVVLATMAAKGGPVRILAGLRRMDVHSVRWVNNRRMVFSARPSTIYERGVGPGLHAINIDGSKRVHLVAHNWDGTDRGNALPPNTVFISTVRGTESNDVYVGRFDPSSESFDGYTLFRLNTETANLTAVDAPMGINRVLMDHDGMPRVATKSAGGRNIVLHKDPASAAWRTISSTELVSSDGIIPYLVTRSGQLYVSAYNGRNTAGLYRFDLATGRLDPEPVIGLKQFDVNGNLILAPDREHVLGARYETSERITTWFDDTLRQIQQKVDAQLPSTINELDIADDGMTNSDTIVVRSYSDSEPGFWQLYHRSTGKFTKLGTEMPKINPLQMADTKFIRYKARDGREIPGYLTVPKNAGKNLPMVVMVHGGPWARGGHLEWHREVQFLATRGYAVLQPEFRGSTGFGRDHFTASFKQWGRAMQDDVADGARWAIEQGVADSKRICIAGASYGGYATLMGLIRNPELFRCGINWVGVTDIDLLYTMRFTNTSQEAKIFGLPRMIGDQVKDAAMLREVSPLVNAEKITQPLLLAYGRDDRTVPIEHGKKFYAAVSKTNPRVEWVEYADEGHGWRHTQTNLDFWGRVEKFLAREIGQPAPAAPVKP